MEAIMRVLIDVNQKTTSADLVDQLLKARLLDIRDEMLQWSDNSEIAAACKVLLDWMATPGE